MAASVFPPDNGQGPIRFLRSYLDDVTGIPVREDQAVRDRHGRLRNVDDVDQPDRDELMIGWEVPYDRALAEEPLE